jgi:hypothetical protein
VFLKGRGFFPTGRLYPAEPSQVREVNDEGMETATCRLKGEASHVSFSKLIDIIGIYGTLITFSQLFFSPGRPVEGSSSDKCCLVLVTDIGLRSTGIRVYLYRAVRSMPEKKPFYELGTAERSEKTAPARS